jgi:hypothetical protein
VLSRTFTAVVYAFGCTVFAATPAIANWADEIDQNPQDASDFPVKKTLEEPVAPAVRGVRFNDKPFNLQLRIGASTTVGELGIMAEYDLLDRVNVGLGIGTNIVGLMPGAHLRLRPIVSRNNSGVAAHAVFTELGLSRGFYSGGAADGVAGLMCETCYDDPIYKGKPVWWGQVEVGWEIRWASGLLLRASTGIAAIIAEPSWQCTKSGTPVPCTGTRPRGWVEAYTFAIGYAF